MAQYSRHPLSLPSVIVRQRTRGRYPHILSVCLLDVVFVFTQEPNFCLYFLWRTCPPRLAIWLICPDTCRTNIHYCCSLDEIQSHLVAAVALLMLCPDSVESDAPGLALSRLVSLLSLLVVVAVIPLLQVAMAEDGFLAW